MQLKLGDFRTLYGEEVTGKYSEDQIDALMLQAILMIKTI